MIWRLDLWGTIRGCFYNSVRATGYGSGCCCYLHRLSGFPGVVKRWFRWWLGNSDRRHPQASPRSQRKTGRRGSAGNIFWGQGSHYVTQTRPGTTTIACKSQSETGRMRFRAVHRRMGNVIGAVWALCHNCTGNRRSVRSFLYPPVCG